MTEPATQNPLSAVKAQILDVGRRLIQPHTLTFNLGVVAMIGLITTIFATIILLMVMVAANCNLFNYIE